MPAHNRKSNNERWHATNENVDDLGKEIVKEVYVIVDHHTREILTRRLPDPKGNESPGTWESFDDWIGEAEEEPWALTRTIEEIENSESHKNVPVIFYFNQLEKARMHLDAVRDQLEKYLDFMYGDPDHNVAEYVDLSLACFKIVKRLEIDIDEQVID